MHSLTAAILRGQCLTTFASEICPARLDRQQIFYSGEDLRAGMGYNVVYHMKHEHSGPFEDNLILSTLTAVPQHCFYYRWGQ